MIKLKIRKNFMIFISITLLFLTVISLFDSNDVLAHTQDGGGQKRRQISGNQTDINATNINATNLNQTVSSNATSRVTAAKVATGIGVGVTSVGLGKLGNSAHVRALMESIPPLRRSSADPRAINMQAKINQERRKILKALTSLWRH